ncbi:hypothetical protein HanHA89_Chr16g0679441 [Helianthus annuus]|nr:hypothetical protein HanHA89_Chr16g0679441 [Helianthus annuus]
MPFLSLSAQVLDRLSYFFLCFTFGLISSHKYAATSVLVVVGDDVTLVLFGTVLRPRRHTMRA